MFIKPIPLEFVKKTSKKHAFIIAITVKAFWKTFDGKKIPFLANENLKHIKLVRKLIFKKLSYFEKFFSKKKLTHIAPLKPGYDISDPLAFGPFKYKTPIKYIPFKKEHIKELFV